MLKACKGTLAHNEKKCPVSGLHVNFAKREQTAKLSGLFKEDKQRGMVEREI